MYEKLQRRPKHFQSFTGISVEQFSEILKAFRPVYADLEHECLMRPDRKRKIGGGRQLHRDRRGNVRFGADAPRPDTDPLVHSTDTAHTTYHP